MKTKALIIVISIAILLFIATCIFKLRNADNFVLNGNISEEFNNQYIMLFTFYDEAILSVDTTCIKNGKFQFTGKEYLTDKSLIVTGNYPNKVIASYVILERGNIVLNLNNINQNLFMSQGTYLNNEMKIYSDSVELLTQEIEKIYNRMDENQISSEKGRLLTQILYNRKDSIITNLILKNKNNLAGALIFSENLRSFGLKKVKSIYNQVSDYLKSYPTIVNYIQQKEHQKLVYERGEKSVGKLIPNRDFESMEGIKNLSDYIGKSKLLVIDFWASWCGPCIAEFPYLKQLYVKYANQGLSILSISMDEQKKDWYTALEKHNMPWNQLLIKQTESEHKNVMEIYNFLAIPHLILIDENGKIVAVNKRKDALMSFINEYFK